MGVDLAIDALKREIPVYSGGPKGRKSVFSFTARDCLAKAGPPEYFVAQPEADRPIRKSIGNSGNTAKTALPCNGIPALNRIYVLIRIQVVRAQKISGAKSGARRVGPSVQSGDSVQPPPLGSEGRPQEAGKPAEWIRSCLSDPAG
jgi:hypothetical protein